MGLDCSRNLRELTRDCHERVESVFSLDELVASRDQYVTGLLKWHEVLLLLEEPILKGDLLPDTEVRRKLPLIRADLADLGDAEPPASRLHRDPLLNRSVEFRLGCAYVFEGSTLGGKIIARRVADELGFTASFGARFFNCYGNQVGPMWRSFLEVLNKTCDDPFKKATAVDGARFIFHIVENKFLAK